ncbi:hypothetical protein [Consotaella aegiceratis]|uniref:hypothetical protein n=1 Tax=Consotaella aegiceratis TaxID=3097961 RepID=UPI002F3F07A0
MTGRILPALTSSFDPDALDDGVDRATAIHAGARNQFIRFVRINGEQRWERLSDRRRQAWIDDFEAGLDAALATGWRPQ